jgi:cytoskeleton protein RodZ
MAELGQLLRETREAKGLTLADVELATRIRASYLEALEAEAYDCLPGEVSVRGFLRNYAAFLGLKPADVLALYGRPAPTNGQVRSPDERLRLKDTAIGVPLSDGPRSSPVWWVVLSILLLAAIGLAGYVAFVVYRIDLPFVPFAIVRPAPTPVAMLATEAPSPTFTATSTAMPTATPVATDTPTPTPAPTDTPTVTPTPTPKVYRGVELSVEITSRSWLRVEVDGAKVFEGFLEAGEKRVWEGAERVLLRAGNAGGVLVTLNGELLGPLGKPDETVDKEWLKPSPTAVG